MVRLPRQHAARTYSRSVGVFFRSLKESACAQVGQHWKCAGDTELWYHQLGRVDPPRPPAAAPYAADYAAKERHGPAGGASNDPKNGSRATSQSELLPSIIRWPRPSGSYENKEFMRYSKMDVLDFSYLFDTPMDAVLLNLGVHSYVLDPHVRQPPTPSSTFFALPILFCVRRCMVGWWS